MIALREHVGDERRAVLGAKERATYHLIAEHLKGICASYSGSAFGVRKERLAEKTS